MATVKSIPRNNSTSFFVNDAIEHTLDSFEITEESPPKSDFDIDKFLSDNEPLSKQQCSNDVNWNSKANDSKASPVLSEEVCVLSSSAKKDSDSASLSALAADHFKKNETLSDLCFDGDFNLSNILSNDCSVSNAKNTESCENFNLFDLCLGVEVCSPNIKCTPVAENDAIVDLSNLVDSSHIDISHSEVSLETLAASHFLSSGLESKSKKYSDSFMLSLKNDGSDIQSAYSLDNILPEEKDSNAEVEIEDVLSELSSFDNSETNDIKHESSDENFDGHLIPDVDLSFCIKKNVKQDKFPFYTQSPESSDSGFDETGLSLKFSIPSQNNTSCTDSLIPINSSLTEKEKLTCSKESLLCRALSARPKIDNVRKTKLKKIRNEMLNYPLNFMRCNGQQNSHVSKRFIDQSNDCVTISIFLKVADKK